MIVIGPADKLLNSPLQALESVLHGNTVNYRTTMEMLIPSDFILTFHQSCPFRDQERKLGLN